MAAWIWLPSNTSTIELCGLNGVGRISDGPLNSRLSEGHMELVRNNSISRTLMEMELLILFVYTIQIWRIRTGNWLLDRGQSLNPNRPTGDFGYQAWHRISKITDGFGAWTELDYKSLAQSSVYQRGSGAGSMDFGEGSAVLRHYPVGLCSVVCDKSGATGSYEFRPDCQHLHPRW